MDERTRPGPKEAFVFIVERLIAGLAIVAAAHFSMGFINPSAGGSGGSLLFPYATNAASTWLFGSLDRGMLALLIPVMIGIAGIAVLAFFLGFLATFGLWVPTDLWRPLIVVATVSSAILLVLHPSVWVIVPLGLDLALMWVASTAAWAPAGAAV